MSLIGIHSVVKTTGFLLNSLIKTGTHRFYFLNLNLNHCFYTFDQFSNIFFLTTNILA